MWLQRQRPGSNLGSPFARVRDIRGQSRSLGRSACVPRYVRFYTFMSYTHLRGLVGFWVYCYTELLRIWGRFGLIALAS